MFINEQNGANQWRQLLTENFNVQDQEKLNWVSQYAAIHEIHESQIGVNAMATTNAAGAGIVPGAGVGPVYATPLNTTGMGNPYAPDQMPTQDLHATPDYFRVQAVGSGDIPVSTLPMALNVALLTIGLELVPVIPAKGPWHMLSYMDFPYAGGKLGRVNETSFDGKGEGNENKPIYVKVTKIPADALKELRGYEKDDTDKWVLNPDMVPAPDDEVTIGVFKGKFIDFGRMDGALLLKVVSCGTGETVTSITKAFEAATSIEVKDKAKPTFAAGTIGVDFVQTSVDLVDGFANFATGQKAPMTRAENETGTGNTIGLRLFSKWIQMGSYEVTGTVTRQQLQDLPLYGVDAVGKVMEAMQNEITQHINQRILDKVWALGWQNAEQQLAFQGANLNLYFSNGTETETTLNAQGIYPKDAFGQDFDMPMQNVVLNTSAENYHTYQRRVMSRILAASNLIQTVGRRGRGTWVVVNPQLATVLQDVAGYVIAPMANTMAQDGSQDLYMGGSVAGLKVYVDPYMKWNDCRVLVGRKGDANSPGVVFLPYILADQVSITAEGTMAPKMLLNSRFAVAEIGFYPETQYYAFAVAAEQGLV